MKVFELYSLGCLHSSVVEPAGSNHSSSDGHSLENSYRKRGSLVHRAQMRTTIWSVAINVYETTIS